MQKYFPFLEHLGINDAIDILLVATILYRMLLIVQGTRAVQMVLGITALASLYWLSYSYELYSLNWLLNHFFQYFFLIIIILFQDQIKSALVSFGETKMFRKNKIENLDEVIEEVIDACTVLCKEKTGALVIFERNNGLMNYAQTGTIFDCKIHSDIIYSLFQLRSPLHDGAIIISGDKIQAAGCFLPLSKNVDIDRHYGTRHRAALGISEVSDAVAIIVSEETGKISLCSQGILITLENETDFRNYLRKCLKSDEDHDFTLFAKSGAIS